MSIFQVEGGHKLKGSIEPQGAKNEALQVLAAALLTKEEVTIRNLPDIRDVNNLIKILEELGVKVRRAGSHAYSFKADEVNIDMLYTKSFFNLATKLRGSILIVGPLLARFGVGIIPSPGGDKIGRRRLDVHVEGLTALGAEFEYEPDNKVYAFRTKGRLQGTYMLLDEASVTGTANIIMAAVLAKGKTTIYHAASEPYIQQLCKMLNSMGAKISGVGSNLLTIEGVEELGGTEHTVQADMIEVGSLIGLAAITKSEITIKGVKEENLGIIPKSFSKIGVNVHFTDEGLVVPEHDHYTIKKFVDGSIMTISDGIWPALTPDLISVFLVTAIQAKGSVLIHQKMFESRLFFVDKLIDMGAQIILCDPHRATVIGINREYNLRATNMSSPDIRAGVALLIAAMSANGTSTIHNIEQIDRGYEKIDERLNKIGAKIKRINLA